MPVLGIMVRSSLGSSPAVSTKEIRHQTQLFPRLASGDGGGKKRKNKQKEEKKWKEREAKRKRKEEKTELCEEHQAKGNSAESSSVVDMFYSPFAGN